MHRDVFFNDLSRRVGRSGVLPPCISIFVLAALIQPDPVEIQRCFKRVRTQRLKKRYRDLPELKYNNTNAAIKRRVLERLGSCDVEIGYAVLRKEQVRDRLKRKPQILYNYLAGSLVSRIITRYHIAGPVEIIVDKSLYGLQRDEFDLLRIKPSTGTRVSIWTLRNSRFATWIHSRTVAFRQLILSPAPCILHTEPAIGRILTLLQVGWE